MRRVGMGKGSRSKYKEWCNGFSKCFDSVLMAGTGGYYVILVLNMHSYE